MARSFSSSPAVASASPSRARLPGRATLGRGSDGNGSRPLRSVRALVLLTVAVLIVAGCGSSTTESALDEPGRDACAKFVAWASEATLWSREEHHEQIRAMWGDASDTSNTVIRQGVRLMLRSEVAGDIEALANASAPVGEECVRLT